MLLPKSALFTFASHRQAAWARIKGPLTALEAAQIEAGLAYYGKQPRRWEEIVRLYMPYRSAAPP